MSLEELPEWLTYPGSFARLRFTPQRAAQQDEIAVVCNAQGLASLVGALLWLTSFSDHGSMSLSALPFVQAEGPLALSVVIAVEEQPCQGDLVKLDKGQQFEWRVHDDQLTALALSLHRIATSPEYVDYFAVNLSPASDASLRFEVVNGSANGQLAT